MVKSAGRAHILETEDKMERRNTECEQKQGCQAKVHTQEKSSLFLMSPNRIPAGSLLVSIQQRFAYKEI